MLFKAKKLLTININIKKIAKIIPYLGYRYFEFLKLFISMQGNGQLTNMWPAQRKNTRTIR